MDIDWPVLSDEVIEQKAELFRNAALDKLQIIQTSPVPIEQIAELYLGYDFEFVEDETQLPADVIGGIDFDSNTIIINASIEDHIGRYNFTIAHEIGHHELHRELFLKKSSELRIMCRGGSKRPIEELQADRFAEALLMPKDLITECFKGIKDYKVNSKRSRRGLASRMIQSSGLSNVSVSAMEMRLIHLGLIPTLSDSSHLIPGFLLKLLKLN